MFNIVLELPHEARDSNELRVRFQSLVVNVLAVVAETRLFALFLDDVHEADDSALDLISTIVNSKNRMVGLVLHLLFQNIDVPVPSARFHDHALGPTVSPSLSHHVPWIVVDVLCLQGCHRPCSPDVLFPKSPDVAQRRTIVVFRGVDPHRPDAAPAPRRRRRPVEVYLQRIVGECFFGKKFVDGLTEAGACKCGRLGVRDVLAY